MRYITFDEFTQMGGQLPLDQFNRFSARAECELNNVTFGRLKNTDIVIEEVKACMFELITYLSSVSQNGSAEAVASFSNDGYSVSYAEQKTAAQQTNDIIYTYLADTGLLYCGVDY